jgi:hypothetical protein
VTAANLQKNYPYLMTMIAASGSEAVDTLNFPLHRHHFLALVKIMVHLE